MRFFWDPHSENLQGFLEGKPRKMWSPHETAVPGISSLILVHSQPPVIHQNNRLNVPTSLGSGGFGSN